VQLKLEYEAPIFLSLVASRQLKHQIGIRGTLTGKRCTLYRFINRPAHVVYIRNI
jgi:hypothetical protein